MTLFRSGTCTEEARDACRSTRSIPGRRFTASPNRIIATLFGAVYMLVGLLGFFWAERRPVRRARATVSNPILGIFEVNPLHNMAHLLIGVALLIAGAGTAAGGEGGEQHVGAAVPAARHRRVLPRGDPRRPSPMNFLSLNVPDHILHLASALVLLAAGLGADRGATRAERAAGAAQAQHV